MLQYFTVEPHLNKNKISYWATEEKEEDVYVKVERQISYTECHYFENDFMGSWVEFKTYNEALDIAIEKAASIVENNFNYYFEN